MTSNGISRRAALRAMTSVGVTGLISGRAASEPKARPVGPEVILFSKPFQSLSYDELAEFAVRAGYAGVEFPVRPGGHIEPLEIEDELPKAVEAFTRRGLRAPLIATGINAVSEAQSTRKILGTAAKLGIQRFRMASYRYDLKRSITAQLDGFSRQLDDVVALSREFGIKPLYQNHSGTNYVGAPIWDVHWMIAKHRREDVGLAFDIGHALVEGSQCWPVQFQLVRDYVDTAYIKDPTWDPVRKRFEWAPLGEGLIPAEYFPLLAETEFKGPVSIHVEYLDHGDPADLDRFRSAFRNDLAALRRVM